MINSLYCSAPPRSSVPSAVKINSTADQTEETEAAQGN